jgi:uncharacterized protein YhaN
MKLRKLELIAFGPFSGLGLDFGNEGLQLVYGKNEAGKSTALRAISGLFYGIPRNTEDAHLHKMPDLRIGGVMIARDGTQLAVVRRKGKDNTLLDRAGQPVDEAAMSHMLGGISLEQFLTMFGLDHITLRRGGQALLLGKGHAGESLFAAAMAGGELHKVLREVRADADALFSPKAHARPLNEALRAFHDAQKRTRELSTSPDSVEKQNAALDELQGDREKCEAEGRRLRVERAELARRLLVLPRQAKRRTLDDRRRALGPLMLLAPDAASTRVEHERTSAAATAEAARLEAELLELTVRKDALVVPESLALQPDVPVHLSNRVGALQKGALELPRIQAEIEELDQQARDILGKMGTDAALDTRRLPAPTQARIRQLALEVSGVAQAQKDVRRARLQKETRLASLREELTRLPPSVDWGGLKKAASRAEREGPLEHRLAELTARAEHLEITARAELSSMGLGDCPLDRAVGLPLPTIETVERSQRALEDAEREARVAASDARSAKERVEQVGQEVEALRRGGSIPTEADLAAARRQRDETFARIREPLGHAPRVEMRPAKAKRQHELAFDYEPLVARYGAEVKEADELADRLRREAERVSQLASLLAERDRAEQKRALAEERAEGAARARDAALAAFRALFQSSGIDPGPAPNARSWLGRHAAVAQSFEQIAATRAEASALFASIERHKQALRDWLGADLPPAIGLEALVDRAATAVTGGETLAARRAELERGIKEIETEVLDLSQAAAEQERAEARLLGDWRAAVAPLGLGEDPTPAEVTVVMDLLKDAQHKLDEVENARRRAAAIERDGRTFAREMSELSARHAPDLASLAPDRAAEQLVERALRARSALAERREVERQIEQSRERLTAARERQRAAAARLADSMREAHVESLDALALAEQRSDEARRLDSQIADIDAELAELEGALPDAASAGDGVSFDATSVDSVTVRLEEVDQELAALSQRESVIHQRLGSYQAGLEKLARADASAAEAAADAESALARVRELAERYARSKIAAGVLSREIEEYRVQHQGPVLERASALFRRMTLGSFAELRTDYDEEDQPVLSGVRGDGEALGVPGMSEGTRDQLFLALRLATLERYAEANEPLPVVLDDILIHFDDDRARAALAALGELSRRAQVLFFTHHARLVELAQETLGRGELCVHELPSRLPPEAPGAAARPN